VARHVVIRDLFDASVICSEFDEVETRTPGTCQYLAEPEYGPWSDWTLNPETGLEERTRHVVIRDLFDASVICSEEIEVETRLPLEPPGGIPTPTPTPTPSSNKENQGQVYDTWYLNARHEQENTTVKPDGSELTWWNGKDGMPKAGESQCNSSGDCLPVVFDYDLAELTSIATLVNTPTRIYRNDVAGVMYGRKFEVIRDPETLGPWGIVLTGDPEHKMEHALDGGAGPYLWYQIHSSPYNLYSWAIDGVANYPAHDSTPDIHGVEAIGFGDEPAKDAWQVDTCGGDPDCVRANWSASDEDATLLAITVFDQLRGRLGTADGAVYYGPGDHSIEGWMTSRGYVNFLHDPANENRTINLIAGLPNGTIIPFVPQRAGSFNLCFEVNEATGMVEMKCEWSEIYEWTREFSNNTISLNPEDYRGPWGIPSLRGKEFGYAIYGVSPEYLKTIIGDQYKFDELSQLVPAEMLHIADIPEKWDIGGSGINRIAVDFGKKMDAKSFDRVITRHSN
jgi:hypothetical protein